MIMGLWSQIILGTVYLTLCSGLHLALIVFSLPWLSRAADATTGRRMRLFMLLGLSFAVIVIGHSVQVWIWAIAFLYHEALSGLEPAVYFALVSYTTLGYGDLLPAQDMRIFGAFPSVAGLLTFGISTAFLVGMAERAVNQTEG